MKISVIIVNYNVKYFLEQCLYSVQKALKNIEGEIIVVDNNSVDGSCGMLHEKFPEICLIENKDNKGFSKANNQAIKISKGEYVLLLNPDTVVEEDTFEKIIAFMDKTPNAGGLGVKMIDGNGKFLPESKRGLPTPLVAFCKIFGLAKLFPKSKYFGRYHLGFLDKNKTHKIEILAGAFMLMRKSVLNITGLLDEDYFMYGEDIDLSYRIIKEGYNNYYFPETTIIHYKGESTKKGSINYVRVFYNAMIIFAHKHFTSKNARLYSIFINLAIYFRAFLSLVSRFYKQSIVTLIDIIIIYLGYLILTPWWAGFNFSEIEKYPSEYINIVVPSYILIWILSVFFLGGYDKPIKLGKIFRGMTIGTLIILTIYALLPEHYRFSRALIVLGFIWSLSSIIIFRLGLHLLGNDSYKLWFIKKKRLVIVGYKEELVRIETIINQTEIKSNIVGYVYPEDTNCPDNFLGNFSQIHDIINIHRLDEIIYSGKDIKAGVIIKNMLLLSTSKVNFKIAPPESLSIIGSNSINTAGELYVINVNSISKPSNLRNKRILDLFISLFLLATSIINVWFVNQKLNYLKNIIMVFVGKKSMVGYCIVNDIKLSDLPKIKNGILFPYQKKKNTSIQNIEKRNLLYAKDYKIVNDIIVIFSNFRSLGQ